jgi:protein-S-isoprenylcysteine O-methyltransferase
MRHPEYSSFLIWTVGTQGLLCNPLSTVALTLALWRFFSKQVLYLA